MTPRIKSGGKFHRIQVFYFTGPESAFGMNPGACILDAFGQTIGCLGRSIGLVRTEIRISQGNSRIASPRTPECLTPTVLTMGARTCERYQPGIGPRPTPFQNGDEVVLIPPVGSPPLPSDTCPRAIGLSPSGRSS